MATTEQIISLVGVDQLAFLGFNDANLSILESRFNAVPVVRGDTVIIRGEGEDVELLSRVVNEMIYMVRRNGSLMQTDVESIIDVVAGGDLPSSGSLKGEELDDVILFANKSVIKARGERQLEYVQKVRENDIVFSIGPAGTGKTYLAVAMAVNAYRNRDVTRIILTRPAVEAGENLGFLPGDLQEKIDPYLRPLYDALDDMIPPEKLKSMTERRAIEVAPLAFMRGRTLNNAFVILDEAQNTTALQMKMFLTRLGPNSRAIITGDLTQVDLPKNVESGLVQAESILNGIEGIGFIYFDKGDVVRHKLVKEIIRAYEEHGVSGGV
ncbi:MAG: PhoH family protein [Ignavibacteriae bacterium]|nr:PhoH family protein [Ignavibacteriota bacterium]MCB9217062.1 PhoH family protein [Ignavibacteria bacterium]